MHGCKSAYPDAESAEKAIRFSAFINLQYYYYVL